MCQEVIAATEGRMFMWWRSSLGGLVCVALMMAQGCTFDPAPLESRQCSNDAECGEAQVCVGGYCQEDLTADLTCEDDATCDDGQFCNGAETCAPDDDNADSRGCVAGAAQNPDDGVACTVDICDEQNDTIVNTPGPECCTGDLDCQVRLAASLGVSIESELPLLCVTSVCNSQLTCETVNKEAQTPCVAGEACDNTGACDGAGVCVGEPDDGRCDDDLFCNGVETCAPDDDNADNQGCLSGAAPTLDDDDPCTDDACDEDNDAVVNTPNNQCGCTQSADCVPDVPDPCLTYQCISNQCETGFAAQGTACDDGFDCTIGDNCDGAGACRAVPNDIACGNDLFCDGAEICDPTDRDADARGCISGEAVEFDDQNRCTDDSCDEVNDRVVNTPNGQCVCEQDSDCTPDNPDAINPCLAYVCSPQQTCVTELRPDDTDCDDGVACTVDDTCQTGACQGTPTDAACDDGLFCTGVEICQPGNPESDPISGCRATQLPIIDDEVDCTVDACDEDNNRVVHAPNDPDCDNDLFCDGQERCDLVLDCVAGVPLQLDDGIACTTDACDEGNDRITNSPTDARCDNNLFCDGAETCAPQDNNADADGCLDGEAPIDDFPPQPDCVEVTCDETNDQIVTNDDACMEQCMNDGQCQAPCRLGATCDPEDNGADVFGCVFTLADDGDTCETTCGQQALTGVCQAGACEYLPEGPTGQNSCDDGIDNDCDGEADNADNACLTPDVLAISVEESASTGLDAQGALIQLTPRAGNNDVFAQDPNLYCVSRIVGYEQPFDDTLGSLNDATVTFLDPDGQETQNPSSVTSGVTFDGPGSALGVEVCDGASVIIQPLAMPSPPSSTTFILSVRMAGPGLALGQSMVLSYRNQTTEGFYVPLTAVVGELGDDLQTFQFLLHNGGSYSPLRVRFDIFDADGNPDGACGFIDEVRLEETSRVEFDFRRERAYPQWTFGDNTRNAREDAFGGPGFRINEFFTANSLDPNSTTTLAVGVESNNNNSLGTSWRYDGALLGSIQLPTLTAPPEGVARRGAPIILGMRGRGVGLFWAAQQFAMVGFSPNGDPLNARQLGTFFPSDDPLGPAHLRAAWDLTQTTANRTMMVLPEEARPLIGRSFGLSTTDTGLGRVDIDDVNLYVHTRALTESFDVAVLGPAQPETPTIDLRLRHARSGQARVQCFWQIPDDPDTITVASEPARITFQ